MANAVSSLFSGIGASSGFGINFSDYAAIKNGSYRKLLTAYYGLDSKTSKARANANSPKDWVVNKADRYAIDEESKDKNTTTEANPEKKAYATVQNDATALKSSTEKLMETGEKSIYEKVEVKDEDGKTSLEYDTDKIYSAVKTFVSDYNKAITDGAASNSTNVNRSARTMTNYTKANKNALNAIGITIGSDNKLSIDEEKFKGADMERVQALFTGKNSYGSQISSQAGFMNNYAKSASAATSTYTQSGKYNYYDYSALFNSSI